MSRRIDIELTSTRDDGSWTWRAAGAREPKGTVPSAMLPPGAAVGQVLRVEIEGHLDGLSVVAVVPPKTARSGPERLELKPGRADQPLVTSTLEPRRPGERARRDDRARGPGRGGGRGRGDRGRPDGRHDHSARPAPAPVEDKPRPKRLRAGKAHRTALLASVLPEQRPIAEQLLAGGIPAVRQAIDKQNEELKATGKSEVKPDALLRVAEELRGKASAATWRDRAEAAAAIVDEIDLRDLRSVVNASGDAGRDDDSKALAGRLREALSERVEQEHTAWLTELAETVDAGRVVRALRLSSRPPKAGAPIPGDVATRLAEATATSLTAETAPDRWATVLDALAYSPVRRRVIPQSLPDKLDPDLRATIARLASRLPEIAHIFDIEPDPAAERAARNANRRGPRRDDRGKGGKGRGDRGGRGAKGGGGRGGDAATTPSGDAGRATGARRARAGSDRADRTARTATAGSEPDGGAEPTPAGRGSTGTGGSAPAGEEDVAAPKAAGSPPAGAGSVGGGQAAAPGPEGEASEPVAGPDRPQGTEVTGVAPAPDEAPVPGPGDEAGSEGPVTSEVNGHGVASAADATAPVSPAADESATSR